jgi:hypothetical protein
VTESPFDLPAPAGQPLGSAEPEELSRSGLIGKGGLALAGALLVGGAAAESAAAATKLVYEVAPNVETIGRVNAPAPGEPFPTGPFFIDGGIFRKGTISQFGFLPAGAPPLGTYRAWGWLFDGKAFGAVMHEIYLITGRGEIHAQGHWGTSVRLVLGGTGRLTKVRRTAGAQLINPANQSFRVTFTLG